MSLDFNTIAKRCLIVTDKDTKISSAEIIEQLEGLKSEFSDIQIITIFNHFLLIEHKPEVLIYLLKTLDKYRDSSSVEAITRLLLMKEHIAPFDTIDYTNVRVFCVKALSNLKNHQSMFVFLDCLNNKNENYKVRLNCADALGRLGDKYAVTPLIDIMTDESEKSVYVRESAATALGMLGDKRAADSLVSILETKSGLMDKFSYLKERVIEALSKLTPENERTFNALKNSLQDENPQVRVNAIEAIMNYELEESYDIIKKMLKDNNEEVAENAVVALFNLKGEEALDEILKNPYSSKICIETAQKIYDSEECNENADD